MLPARRVESGGMLERVDVQRVIPQRLRDMPHRVEGEVFGFTQRVGNRYQAVRSIVSIT